MKVILTKNIKGIGRAYDEVSIADGYAINYLIPRKLAVSATKQAIQNAELRRKQISDSSIVQSSLLMQQIATLSETRVVIKTKANEKGHLYDAVGEPEIRRAMKEQLRIELPDNVIKLEKPVKELGTFDIPIATAETFGKFSITIESE